MKTKITYICSYDDAEFDNKEDCSAYEKKIKTDLKGVQFYFGKERKMPKTIDDYETFYNDATRIKFKNMCSKKTYWEMFGMCSIDKDGKSKRWDESTCLNYHVNNNGDMWQEDSR